jgi:XTP/dITP diphosphohydrolase
MTLLLATTNPNKVGEVRPLFIATGVTLLTLADVATVAEPDETGSTFWENARLKALAYADATGQVAVAEDSGLVIDSLDGDPGVRSARFLGDDVAYPARFAAIYERMAAVPAAGRAARFVTALAVAHRGALLFETETAIEGIVAPHPAGSAGFGYDPIFLYPPFGKTTAEMTPDEKSAVSHRARAFRDLRRALLSNQLTTALS